MKEELVSTDDLAAMGRRTDVKEIPIHSEDALEPGTLDAYGAGGARMVKETPSAPLFMDTEGREFRSKWDQIQIAFVDEPRKAVQDADSLVAQTMKRLAEIFSDERKKMEAQWDKGGDVSTEDLRVALQRYRSFFNRLLAM